MLFSFILGAIIGSFINVVVYRLPRNMSIIYPSSHCPFCKKRLRFYELIPILSFLFQKGRCRNCKAKIPERYFLIEIINALLFLILFNKFGFNIYFLKYALFISLLVIVSFIDLEHYIISNEVVFFGVIAGILFAFLEKNFMAYFLGAILGLFVMTLIYLFSRGGMGAGDVKLAFLIGLFVGKKLILLSLLISFVVGAFIGILLILSKIKNRKDPIPFGPYLSIGAVFTIFYGEEILNYYINTFLM
mgnify:CR=1 FL=1